MDQHEIDRFGRTFQEFLDLVVHPSRERAGSQPIIERVEQFLGADPLSLPVVSETFEPYQHPTVQLAIDAILSRDDVTHDLIGTAGHGREQFSFSELLQMSRLHLGFGVGAVDYATLPVSADEEMTCVRFGLYLIDDGTTRTAVLVRGASRMREGKPAVEVLGLSRDDARRWLDEFRAERVRNDKLRGQVLSFAPAEHDPSASPIQFHRRPDLPRADVILPDGVLERIERQVIGIAEHRERLSQENRHLKRGVLLYGPPGTGKTHTVRYLTGQLTDVTVVLLAGPAIGYVSQACELARSLQPAVIVLEDVDLVAEDRSFGGGGGAASGARGPGRRGAATGCRWTCPPARSLRRWHCAVPGRHSCDRRAHRRSAGVIHQGAHPQSDAPGCEPRRRGDKPGASAPGTGRATCRPAGPDPAAARGAW